MANANNTPRSGRNATRKGKRVSFRKRVSAALRNTLKHLGIERASFEALADISDRTARDWLSGKRLANFATLEACGKPFWLAFVRCFVAEERKAGAI